MKIQSIAVAIALLACGKGKEPTPAPPAPGSVQVLVAGSEPRQLLRYHVAKGTTNLVELALDVDLDAGGQGGPLPTLVMTSEMVVEDVLADGSATVRTTITGVSARDRVGGAITADQMAEQTQLMRGLVLRATLAPEGTLRDPKVETAGKVLPPGITAQLDTLSKSFEQIAMPLPQTPVGVGASWLHTRPIVQDGMTMLTTTTFTLRGIDGDLLTFDSSTVVSGEEQSVTQGGTTIKLTNVRGSGSGKGTVDLSRMTMTGELVAELGSDMSAEGETTRMRMKTVTRLAPGTTAPPPAAAEPAAAKPAAPPPAAAEPAAAPPTSP